jgi:hypothetical protein
MHVVYVDVSWKPKVKDNPVHAIKMAFGAFFEANFGAWPAINFFIFQNGEFGLIRIHAKFWNGISPNRKDVLFESGSNMH